MKKLVAILGLATVSFIYFYNPSEEIEPFEDFVEETASSIEKIETPLPEKSIPKEEVFEEEKAPKVTSLDERREVIGEILNITATSNSLKSIDHIIDERLRDAQSYLSREKYAKFEKVLRDNFNGEKMVERITDRLAEELSIEELNELKKRTEDPFLSKVWSLEDYANSPQGAQAFEDYLIESEKDPPSLKRIALIREFDTAVSGTDSVVELNASLVKGILQGGEERLEDDQVANTTSALAEQMREAVAEKVEKNLLFTYQDLSNEDIKALIRKGRDSSFNKANNIIHAELKKILLEGGKEIGKAEDN